MYYRRNTDATPWVIGIVIFAFIAALAAKSCDGCGVGENGRNAIESQGFTDIKIGDYAWFGCGRDDTYQSHFTAKNSNGKSVSGIVCCGILKGCTVRF